MSVEILHILSYLVFFLLAATIVWLAVIFILHFFVPKALLKTYFCEPYFSPSEIEIFTGFPFAYMRTAMFMRLVAWPSCGKKRGLTQAYALAPPWFRLASKTLIWIFMVICIPLVVLSVFLAFAF
jgi:hypothetical protein